MHYIRWLVPILFAFGLVPLATAQTDQRCFAETGQCIAGRIREFWEQNGGLPVFGYPTGPQQEVMIEGKPYQVQTFERNRLELHPENQRPYDVLLGRLGVLRLEQQGRNWFTFPKSEPQPGCRFFPETGQNVCGDILKAWRANGLEFDGQAGKSEAENLALFGMPISDLQTEQIEGKSYQVQWFERARFELHPENQPPYNVLLGLLGNEVRDNAAEAPSATPVASPMPAAPTPTSAPVPQPPAQITLQGSGSTVTQQIELPSEYNRVISTHKGKRNFIVWAYRANGEKELVANTIGNHNGMRPIEGKGSVMFEVQADGDWTLTVEALPGDPNAAQGVDGRGEYVSGLFTPAKTGPVPFNVSHDGARNFIVWLQCAGGSDLVANEIGGMNGSVMVEFDEGPCYWDVTADGGWSIRPK